MRPVSRELGPDFAENVPPLSAREVIESVEDEGLALRSDEIFALSTLASDQKKVVLKAFDKCGSEYLKPVFDALNGAVSYEDLKILRLCYLGRKNGGRDN